MARVFNGSTQYLSNTSFPNASLPITIAAWIKPNSTSGFQRVGVWRDVNGSQVAGSILLNYPSAGNLANQVLGSSGNSLPSATGTVSVGTWHHAAVVSTSTRARAYLDGVAGSDATYTLTTFSGVTYFDVAIIGNIQYYNGTLAFLAVWSAELNADEITSLGQKLNGVPCGVHPTRIRPESLVACWPLGGFDGDHDGDIWANSYNLTAYNSPTWDEGPAVMYSVPPQIIYPASTGGGGGGIANPALFNAHYQNQGWL